MNLPTALDTARRAATSTGLRAGGFYSQGDLLCLADRAAIGKRTCGILSRQRRSPRIVATTKGALGLFRYSPVVGKSAVDGIHTTRKEASAARQMRADIPDQQAQAFCKTHGRANRMRYSDRRSWVFVRPFSHSPTGVSAPGGSRSSPAMGARCPPCSTAGGFGPRPFQGAAE